MGISAVTQMQCRRRSDISLLVIEDSEPEVELMTYLLQAGGYCVMTATSGEAGLALADQQSVNMVVCDVFLPGINGYEVARRLKAHPALSRIPLLAVTTLNQLNNRDQLRQAGFDGYIGKPIEARTFVDNVESMLTLAGAKELPSTGAGPTVRHILIVDDLRMHANHLCATLEAKGQKVSLANDTARAMELLAAEPIDLIVLDFHLSDQDSLSFLSAVKDHPRHREIPLLFLSASVWGKEERAHLLDMPSTRFLRRPVTTKLLLEEIGNWLH